MGRRSRKRIAPLNAPANFWDWSLETYSRPGVAEVLLDLQDRFYLSVNMLLWCVWGSRFFEPAPDIVIRKAADISLQWSRSVTEPLREVRRKLKAAPPEVPADQANALYLKLKDDELAAERMEQDMLDAFTRRSLIPQEPGPHAIANSRKSLAAYIRTTHAAKMLGFSVSLLETLIGLTVPFAESPTAG